MAFDFSVKGGTKAKCVLRGYVRSLNPEPGKKGFHTLANRIKLSFDANDHKKCELFIKSYCRYNIIGRNDVPVKLKGYFKKNKNEEPSRIITAAKPEYKYSLTENCKLIIE